MNINKKQHNKTLLQKIYTIFTYGYVGNLFFLMFVFFIGFIPHVLAASGFIALAPIPGLTDGGVTANLTQETLANFFNNLYKYLIGISATIAVVQIIWAGIDITMNRDDVSKLMDEKGKIYNAIFGLVLVLSPALVFGIINPNILNMSIAMPPLDTQWTSPISGVKVSTPAPKQGCTTQSYSGPFLETAICSSENTAANYVCKNGLTLQISACKITNADGVCLDTSTPVFCAGKTTTLEAYEYYHSYSGIPFGDSNFVPRDEIKSNTFINGCREDGGVYSASVTKASVLFLGSHAFQITNGCSSDSGIQIDTTKGGGVVCVNTVLTCNAPI